MGPSKLDDYDRREFMRRLIIMVRYKLVNCDTECNQLFFLHCDFNARFDVNSAGGLLNIHVILIYKYY